MNEFCAFFGDGQKVFAFPTRELIEELQHKTGHPIGALFRRFRESNYSLSDVLQVIRIGLIGGGTAPAEADRLVNTYTAGRPLAEVFEVADGAITALFFGAPETTKVDTLDENGHVDAVNDALVQVAA